MIKCQICNKEFEVSSGLSNHIKLHSITKKEYYDTYLKKEYDGICKTCNNITRFNGLKTGYSKYCSKKCISNSIEVQKKKQENSIKMWGVLNPSQSDIIKNKKIESYRRKYQTDSFFQSDKFKHICLENFGVDNPSKSKEIQLRNKEFFKEKYGYENPSQSQEVKEKSKCTCLKNHGTEYPFQSKNIVDKGKQTCLKNYGVNNPSQSIEIQKKIKKTRVDRGYWISDDQLSEYDKYRKLVLYYTEISLKKKYSEEDLKKRKLGGILNALQADHKFSILEGFKQNILPCIIGSQSNLELIPWLDNYKKHSKCSLTKEELFNLYEKEITQP